MLNRPAILVCGILTIHALLLAVTAALTSPTTDEPSHLAAGLYLWRSGKCDFYAVNPPLVKAVASLPVLLAGAKEDWSRISIPPSRTEFNVGREFVDANGPRIFWLMRLARWSCVPFSVLGGWACYAWSTRLFGEKSGYIALILWCFSPTVLGNGALISADVAAAAVGVLAGFAFWKWTKDPTWEHATLSGGALGLCLLTKLTWIILPAVWVLIWIIECAQNREQNSASRRSAVQLFFTVAVGVVVLNVGYAFEGTFTRLGDYQFTCSTLSGKPPRSPSPMVENRFSDTLIGSVPVPVPSSFVQGLDAQAQDFEEPHIVYFAGQRSTTGWWWFYVVTFFLKESPATLLLGAAAVLCVLFRRERLLANTRLSSVWLPPIILFLLVSSHSRLNYYRYLLPALPFVFIWISQVGHFAAGRKIARWAIVACTASAVVTGVASVPHALSYANAFAGGTKYGPWWFADCNYDWGQDLPALRDWLRRHPESRPIRIGYFGVVHPRFAGIEFDDLPAELINPGMRPKDYRISPGWYAISVSHLHGIEGVVHSSNGGIRTVYDSGLTIFESETPLDRAGPSILIYRIEAQRSQ